MNTKFEVITKAVALMEYTMRITSNRKRYPVKYITLVQRIQNRCMDIYDNLTLANSFDIKKHREQRLHLQMQAVSYCNQLSCYIELSMNLNVVGSNTVGYWQRLVSDVLYLTIAWNNRDKAR